MITSLKAHPLNILDPLKKNTPSIKPEQTQPRSKKMGLKQAQVPHRRGLEVARMRVLRPYKIPRSKNSQRKSAAKKIDHYMMDQSMKDIKEINEQKIKHISSKTGMKPCMIDEMIKAEMLDEFLAFFERIQQKIKDSYRNKEPASTSKDSIMRLAVYGFSDIHIRFQVFDVFRHVFKTQWHFSSEPNRNAANRWEMLIVFRQSSNFSMQDIEEFANMLKLSIVCDDIGSKVDEVLMSFVERIDGGSKKSGYLRGKLRDRLNEFRLVLEERNGRQRVLETTGRPLTSGNTLFYYHEMNNARSELESLRDQHRQLNSRYVSEFRAHNVTRKTAIEIFNALNKIHEIMSTQISTLERLRAEISSFDRNKNMIDQIQEILNNPDHRIDPSYQNNQLTENREITIRQINDLVQTMRNEINDPSVANLSSQINSISSFIHNDLENFTNNIVSINDIISTSTNTLREFSFFTSLYHVE